MNRREGLRSLSAGRAAAAVTASAALLMVAACGGAEERSSTLRPPSPVNVAVTISEKRVTVSPPKIGAWQIALIVSNQASASHRLTLEGPRVRRSIGPINPADTGTLKVSVRPGEHDLSADGATGIRPARLVVGPKRPSSQNELLTP